VSSPDRPPRRRRRLLAPALALALAVAAGAAPGAAADQVLTEPGSGASFSVRRELKGRRYTAVGVGLRRVYLVFKVYAVALYVGDGAGRASFRRLLADTGGDLRALRRSPRLYGWLTNGDYSRSLEFVMLRDIEKGRMAGAIRYRLAGELGDLESPELKPLADRFFAAIDIPLRRGQRFAVIQEPGHQIIATLDGRVLVKVRHKRLAAAIWRVYFGPRAIDPGIKKTLVDHIDELLR
jgi:hypothetical protein